MDEHKLCLDPHDELLFIKHKTQTLDLIKEIKNIENGTNDEFNEER
jgi:hypothetical protein